MGLEEKLNLKEYAYLRLSSPLGFFIIFEKTFLIFLQYKDNVVIIVAIMARRPCNSMLPVAGFKYPYEGDAEGKDKAIMTIAFVSTASILSLDRRSLI